MLLIDFDLFVLIEDVKSKYTTLFIMDMLCNVYKEGLSDEISIINTLIETVYKKYTIDEAILLISGKYIVEDSPQFKIYNYYKYLCRMLKENPNNKCYFNEFAGLINTLDYSGLKVKGVNYFGED